MAIDQTDGGIGLVRNCSEKSLVLAPFNSTWSDKKIPEFDEIIDKGMIVDKKVIKYGNRVKDINRQYEMNNNCDLDNGVYNKFVNQSSSSEHGDSHDQSDNDEDDDSYSDKESSIVNESEVKVLKSLKHVE